MSQSATTKLDVMPSVSSPPLRCTRLQIGLRRIEQTLGVGAFDSMPVAIALTGSLDRDRLQVALSDVIADEPALRTRLYEHDGSLYRLIVEPRAVETAPLVEQSMVTVGDAVAARSTVSLNPARQTFARWLLRLGPGEHVLLAVFHRALVDECSKELFVDRLAAAYAQRGSQRGRGRGLPDAYSTYAEVEQATVERKNDFARRHWGPRLEQLTDQVPFSDSVSTRGVDCTAHGDAIRFTIPADTSDRITSLAQAHQVSKAAVLLACVRLLHWIYGGRRDGAVATLVFADARPPDLRQAIGMFTNEMPAVTRIAGSMSLADLLAQTSRELAAVHCLRRYPFTEAAARFGADADPHTLSPAVAFDYRKARSDARTLGGLEFIPDLLLPCYGRRWRLRFAFRDSRCQLAAVLEYDSAMMHEHAAQRLVAQLQGLLGGLEAQTDKRLSEISVLPAEQRRHLLVDLNSTKVEHPPGSVQRLFEEQVRRSPDAVALVTDSEEVTYGDLDRVASSIGLTLADLSVRRGDLVGIYVERGPRLIASLLGALKAGAGYVPLDPGYPAERVDYMFAHSGASAVLTESRITLPPALAKASVVCVDRLEGHTEDCRHRAERPEPDHPDDTAYVIYTSGSTGRPKGVMVSHGALTNLLWAMRQTPGLDAADAILALTTPSFDMSVPELYLPLVVGGRMVIAPRDAARDGYLLAELIERHHVDVVQATPASWRILLTAGWHGHLKRILVGGEALPEDLAAELIPRASEVWNMYGPTETTVWSTAQLVRRAAHPAIGRPLANTRIYVLDTAGQLSPLGVPGEICIGGAGVACGYLHQPELTAERFVPDRFADGGSMYRTGDRGRYREDGTLEHLGRLDRQVKIRGYRIEPAEIEVRLQERPGVRQAAVTVDEQAAGAQLIAYVEADSAAVDAEGLRAALAAILPGYMVPAAVVVLDSFPLTANGKLDRRRLTPPAARGSRGTAGARALTDPERRMAALWAKMLQVDHVGLHDNFFALGGDSLLAARTIAEVRRQFGVSIAVGEMFVAPTIAGLVAAIQNGEARTQPIPRAHRRVAQSAD